MYVLAREHEVIHVKRLLVAPFVFVLAQCATEPRVIRLLVISCIHGALGQGPDYNSYAA